MKIPAFAAVHLWISIYGNVHSNLKLEQFLHPHKFPVFHLMAVFHNLPVNHSAYY